LKFLSTYLLKMQINLHLYPTHGAFFKLQLPHFVPVRKLLRHSDKYIYKIMQTRTDVYTHLYCHILTFIHILLFPRYLFIIYQLWPNIYESGNEPSGSIKCGGSSRLAENPLGSTEGLCSKE
jgi:hypothetical protein